MSPDPYSSLGLRDDFGGCGFALSQLVVMELRCDGGSGVVELFKGVEAFPPKLLPLCCVGEVGRFKFECSNWVMQLATEIYWLVGISCEGFEGDFFWLF